MKTCPYCGKEYPDDVMVCPIDQNPLAPAKPNLPNLIMTRDEEHLRLLSIFHYVVGGLAGLFALFPIIHLTLGLVMVFAPDKFAGKGEPPPAFLGWFFVIFAAMFIVLGWTFAAFVLTTGRFLAQRKHYLFCLVMGGVECLFMPFGTVLGVFTIIVLMQEPVKLLFGANPPTTATNVK
jgi:hypothetical protein